MSTRCHIAFYSPRKSLAKKELKDFEVLLYRHCDGYPGIVSKTGEEIDIGILPDIIPFLHKFNKMRGLDDIEYASAWLMHTLIARNIKDMEEYYKDQPLKVDGSFIGHGICNEIHYDIAYLYAIYRDLENRNKAYINVYSTNLWDDPNLVKNAKLRKKIVLDTSNPTPKVSTRNIK